MTKNVYKQTQQLILEYNKRMRDNENYPNKDQVRDWYATQSQQLIDKGALEFSFLYPDFIGPIEELENLLKKKQINIINIIQPKYEIR